MSRLKQPLLMERRRARALLRGGFFALNDLDRKLLKYIDYNGGFYVELGANDGQSQSNTYYFELKRGWKGVLIEPIPHRFIECQRLRGKNNRVHCAACVPFDYPERFVPMRYADLMTTTEGLTRLNADDHSFNARQHFDQAEAYEFAARARTLTELLDDSNAPGTIDLLSLDVEGAERAVLAGIDFSKYAFKFMLIETKEPEQLMIPGYKIIDQLSHHDYLFSNSPAAAETRSLHR